MRRVHYDTGARPHAGLGQGIRVKPGEDTRHLPGDCVAPRMMNERCVRARMDRAKREHAGNRLWPGENGDRRLTPLPRIDAAEGSDSQSPIDFDALYEQRDLVEV